MNTCGRCLQRHIHSVYLLHYLYICVCIPPSMCDKCKEIDKRPTWLDLKVPIIQIIFLKHREQETHGVGFITSP